MPKQMDELKKHHYIPAFYLRGWERPETGKLVEFRKLPGKLAIKKVTAQYTGFQKRFYPSMMRRAAVFQASILFLIRANIHFVRIADAPHLEMLRPVSNGRFGECRHAAPARLDRPLWAASVSWARSGAVRTCGGSGGDYAESKPCLCAAKKPAEHLYRLRVSSQIQIPQQNGQSAVINGRSIWHLPG